QDCSHGWPGPLGVVQPVREVHDLLRQPGKCQVPFLEGPLVAWGGDEDAREQRGSQDTVNQPAQQDELEPATCFRFGFILCHGLVSLGGLTPPRSPPQGAYAPRSPLGGLTPPRSPNARRTAS